MDIISPEYQEIAQFLAHVGQFLFGLVTVLLMAYAAIFRRKEVFRSELQKRQIEELAVIRRQLHEVWFEFFYLPSIRSLMELNNWSFNDLRVHALDEWEKYDRYAKRSLDLFYKFKDPDYYLFPYWLDRDEIDKFCKSMQKFAPFTLLSSTGQPEAIREEYMKEIRALISQLDEGLRKYA